MAVCSWSGPNPRLSVGVQIPGVEINVPDRLTFLTTIGGFTLVVFSAVSNLLIKNMDKDLRKTKI